MKNVARKKTEEPKKPVGRPTDYNLEIATRICEEIATTTDSYETICERNPDFPVRSTMRRWRYHIEQFRTMYDQARADQADLLLDDMFDIADNGSNDWMERHYKEQTAWVVNGEAIARSRLRVDTRKWAACKLLPKKYGERPAAEEDPPFSDAERAELHAIIAGLVAKHEREY